MQRGIFTRIVSTEEEKKDFSNTLASPTNTNHEHEHDATPDTRPNNDNDAPGGDGPALLDLNIIQGPAELRRGTESPGGARSPNGASDVE